jgi:predicted MFS family arabinose efflux permease
LIGLSVTAGGVGGVLGSAVANVLVRRWPLGRVYVTARIVGGLAAVLLPLATGPRTVVVAVCMSSFFLVQLALANVNVLNSSLRQAVTPNHIRGRMNASTRTLITGVLPLAGLTGGLLTEAIGARPTLWLAAVGYALAIIPILASPIPGLTAMPATATPRPE